MFSDHLDISKQDLTKDHSTGDTSFTDEAVTVVDGTTTRHIRDPFGMIKTEPHSSANRDIAVWELRAQIERSNIEAKYRTIPEAARRKIDREIARKQLRHIKPKAQDCPHCGGEGWIDEGPDGRAYECPCCDHGG